MSVEVIISMQWYERGSLIGLKITPFIIQWLRKKGGGLENLKVGGGGGGGGGLSPPHVIKKP